MINDYDCNQRNGELYHSGVKGMKWGVRKDRTTNGNLSKAAKKRQDKVHSLEQRKERRDKIRNTVEEGVKKTTRVMSAIGSVYLIDQVIFDGVGSNAARTALETIGRTAMKTIVRTRG